MHKRRNGGREGEGRRRRENKDADEDEVWRGERCQRHIETAPAWQRGLPEARGLDLLGQELDEFAAAAAAAGRDGVRNRRSRRGRWKQGGKEDDEDEGRRRPWL